MLCCFDIGSLTTSMASGASNYEQGCEGQVQVQIKPLMVG